MIAQNKIHSREYKTKHKQAIKSLHEMLHSNGIAKRQIIFLFESLNKYKEMISRHEETASRHNAAESNTDDSASASLSNRNEISMDSDRKGDRGNEIKASSDESEKTKSSENQWMSQADMADNQWVRKVDKSISDDLKDEESKSNISDDRKSKSSISDDRDLKSSQSDDIKTKLKENSIASSDELNLDEMPRDVPHANNELNDLLNANGALKDSLNVEDNPNEEPSEINGSPSKEPSEINGSPSKEPSEIDGSASNANGEFINKKIKIGTCGCNQQGDNIQADAQADTKAVVNTDIQVDNTIIQELEEVNKSLNAELSTLRNGFLEKEIEYKTLIDRLELKNEDLKKMHANDAVVKNDSNDMKLMEALESAFQLNEEIAKYRERIIDFSKNNAVAEKKIRNLKEELKVKEEMVSLANCRSIPMSSIRMSTNDDKGKEMTVESILTEELTTITEAYEDLMKKTTELEKRISQNNRKYEVLLEENVDLKNRMKLQEDAKNFIEKEKKRCEMIRKEIQEQKEELRREFENKEMEKRRLEEKRKESEERMRKQENEITALNNELWNYKTMHKKLSTELKEMVKRRVEVENNERKNRKLVEMYKRMLNGDLNEMLGDLEMYRRALRCTLCDLNLKNATITRCMHCFCEDCLQTRIKSRLRTCPICEIEFTMGDVKKLYL